MYAAQAVKNAGVRLTGRFDRLAAPWGPSGRLISVRFCDSC